MKQFLKSAARKILLEEVPENETLRGIYQKIGREHVAERTFYFGAKKMRIKALKTESAPGTAESIIKLLQENAAGKKVLDFGCGQHKSAYLLKMGFLVHSCDILQMDMPNFTKINPDSGTLPFADNQFQITVASEVLEHVESPWQVLLELARVSSESVIVSTPNPASLKSRQTFFKGGYLYWFEPENFSYHISPIFTWQMELFCKRHGFKLEAALGNHEILGLGKGASTLEMAEAMVFKISK